jgi:phosphoglycolate phosphatase
MIRCVLFDLDGTLIDTAPDLGFALNEVRRENDLPSLPLDVLRPMASAGARGLLDAGFGIKPAHETFEPLRRRFLEIYRANLTRQSRLFDGMPEILTLLQQREIAWGIVTNKPGWLTQPLLAELDLPWTPACVISGDSAAQPKPHPAPMLLASTQCGVAPASCVMIGDDERDVVSGRAAGLFTVAAGWGYIQPDQLPSDWGADVMLQTPQELLLWLDQNTGDAATRKLSVSQETEGVTRP